MNKNTAPDAELSAWLTLSFTSGVTPKVLLALLRAYDSAAAALAAPAADLRRVPAAVDEDGATRALPQKVVSAIKQEDHRAAVRAALAWRDSDANNHIITLADEDYPPLLLEAPGAPLLLYARGDLSLLRQKMVAVVGSRGASAAGQRNTEIFARALAAAGVCVVSGLAQGIDAMAHKGALAAAGGTVAVVGTGADIVYPRINRPLAAQIAERGLILSEFPLGTRPLPHHFPLRNRIIGGMSAACLVIEATLKSGSLITARMASEYGREVFAVPGSINSPLHRGCHQLLREGASLAESVNDILPEIGMRAAPKTAPEKYEQSRSAGVSPAAGDEVLPYINYQPTSIDDIAVRSGSSADHLMPLLLELELAGKIVVTAGGGYQRV